MQYISLTMRKMKLLALFLAMVVMSNMGFCQNTPQKVTKVDTVKQTTPMAVSSQKAVATTTPIEVVNFTPITYNDTALKSIQDTLNQISYHQTELKEFLGGESWKVNSWIGLLAMIFGGLAMVFGLGGFVYQLKSANSLKTMQVRRLPFDVFAKKLFETNIVLDILIEIEDSNSSDAQKKYRRIGYGVEKLIDDMCLPDDLIDLTCYKNQKHYELAYSLIFHWRSFNKSIDAARETYKKGDFTTLRELYDVLKNEIEKLYAELSLFEDVINEDAKSNLFWKKRRESSRMRFTMKIISEFNIDIDKRIKKLINPRLFDNDNCFYYPLAIPSVKKLKLNEERNLIEKAYCYWRMQKSKEDKSVALYKLRERYWFKRHRNNIQGLVYNWYLECQEAINAPNLDFLWFALERIAVYKKNPIDFLCLRWLQAYLSGENAEKEANLSFVYRVVYAYNVAEKREAIIHKTPMFYDEEVNYFNDILKNYVTFNPIFWGTKKEFGPWINAKITLIDLLNAFVAEQNLLLSADYLCYWMFNDSTEKEDIGMYNGEMLIPLLKEIGILNGSSFVVKNKEELDEKIKGVPVEILNSRIFKYPETQKFINLVNTKYNIYPFAKKIEFDNSTDANI